MPAPWAFLAGVSAWLVAGVIAWPSEDGSIRAEWGTTGLVAPRVAWGQVYDVADRPPRLRQLTKEIRAAIRRFRRQVTFALARWQEWLPKLALGTIALVVLGTVHRQWFAALRRGDWIDAKRRMALAASMFLALVLDRRTPLVGKGLLVASLVYLTANRDLVWDQRGLLGLADDLAVLGLAAQGFVATCPEPIVEGWARRMVFRGARRSAAGHQG